MFRPLGKKAECGYLCPIDMSCSVFHFRRFSVRHDGCAMKVGTDGVLLGAWAAAPSPTCTSQPRALDVGTGSGVVALMLAQRFPHLSLINGVDIDAGAVAQAQANFGASPWAARLQAVQGDFREGMSAADGRYDLIVSNPPFFTGGKGMEAAREQARQREALPLDILIARSSELLAPHGALAIIIPYDQATEAIVAAAAQGLRLTRRTDVRSKAGKPLSRSLLQWQANSTSSPLLHDTLTLNDSEGRRSEEYRTLTNEFYLSL